MNPNFLQVGQRRQALQHGVVEGDVGLHRLAEHELLELRRLAEQRNRRRDARRWLVVPEPAVDVQLFQVRQCRQPAASSSCSDAAYIVMPVKLSA